jgi:hypothetical protein
MGRSGDAVKNLEENLQEKNRMIQSTSKKQSNRRGPKASIQPHVHIEPVDGSVDESVAETVVVPVPGSGEEIVIDSVPEPKTSRAKKPRSPKVSIILAEPDIPICVSTEEEPTPIQEQVFESKDELKDDLVTCECGSVVSKKSYAKHLKTKKHLAWLTAQETSSTV